MTPLAEALRAAGVGEVVDERTARERYGRDGSHLLGRPAAAVRPRGPDDLVRLVGWARAHRVPIVARGAGSSLDGESVPPDGAVVVDFSGWAGPPEIDVRNRSAWVDPGVVNRELDRALRPHGLFYPPNPGSWTVSTLGGNVTTNAAGPRSFKYGSTRDWVLELEAVLGTGERIRVGGATRKRSVGPDLRALLVGSEGTLGLVTRIRVRLALRPRRRAALVVPLPPEARLCAVAEAIARWPGERVSAIEYLDTISADALAAEARGRIPSGSAVVLVELESASEEEETALLSSVADRLRALGVPGDPLVEPDADELWTLRGRSGPALDGRLGERIREDVAVPIDRIDALRESIDAIARRHGLEVAVFGHVGDGNLHPNFAIDPAGPAAASVRAELLASARALGGTISAEHGVGRLKRDHLPLELDAPSLALLRGLKRLCDPDGILNPGALLPDEPTAAPGADSGAGGSPSGGRGGRSRRASPTVRRGPRAAGHRRRRS